MIKQRYAAIALVAAVTLSCSATRIIGAETNVPSLITDGVDRFLDSGARAALETWLKGSPITSQTDSVLGNFQNFERQYGKFIGWEVVRIVSSAPSDKRIYAVLKYEKGPAWGWFDCYKAGNWIMPSFRFNLQASDIFPPSFLAVSTTPSEMPEVVADGMKAFQESGDQAAFDVWLKGSPVESQKDSVLGSVSKIESFYGKMIGWEPIRVVQLSPSCKRVYAVLKYQKGPAWAWFDCYKNEHWLISSFQINVDAGKILPPQILSGEGNP